MACVHISESLLYILYCVIQLLHLPENSSHFFIKDIRDSNPEYIRQLLTLYQHKILDYSQAPTPLPNPTVGDLCIVSINNCFMRGYVENSTDKSQIKIFCLDIGTSTTVDNSQNSSVFCIEKCFLFHPFPHYFCQITLPHSDLNKTHERQVISLY